MDSYEDVVARQPTGAFSNRKERQRIRAVTEHVGGRLRYFEERRRRLQSYAWWIGVAVPAFLTIYKLVDTFFGRG